jgi:hypothetical protein
MTAKTNNSKGKQRREQKQIPFGDDNQEEQQQRRNTGSLRYATDDEAVRRFGRDDVFYGG